MREKICHHCGTINDDIAHICRQCRRSIDRVRPTERRDDGAAPPVPDNSDSAQGRELKGEPEDPTVLCVSDPGFAARITDGAIMGRGADIDISGVDPECYTSRRHVVFTRAMGRWWIENISDNMKTEINMVDLPRGGKVCVEEGDRLTLADKEFILKVP